MIRVLVRKAGRLALVGFLVLATVLMASCAAVTEFLQADGPDFGPRPESQAGRRVPIPPTVQDFGGGE